MADEFQELQRQNSRLCDTVAEMKKEIKELKGEVEEFFLHFLNKIHVLKKEWNIIPLSTCINFDNLYPVLLNRGI